MPITITKEFESALESIRSGKHILITGKAGTGKSTLLRTYLESLNDENVLVTAPTGVAALNIDGFTIHRSFGFRPGMYPDDLKPGGSWRPGSRVTSVLKAVDVLVIDEISMVRADLFDMIDIALRRIRQSDELFGGVQLVLVGDLLQLPPVVTNHEAELFSSLWDTPYFFSAHCFGDLALTNINLTTVWRQTDEEFIEVLNQVREGSVGDSALSVLNDRVDPHFRVPSDWVTLASHRRTVEKINHERLNELESPRFVSVAEHEGQTDNNSFSGSEELHYAVGARVMTIINDQGGLFVNGSFGTLVAASADILSVRLDHNGETVELGRYTWEIKRPSMASGIISSDVVGTITQFPVILAWAITIHKSQGKTIPKLFINLAGGTATDGQFYVALSRGVDLAHLRFSAPVEHRHIRANNSLVRMIRREVSPLTSASRLVFLSFDGVNFGISDHVARVHAIILEDGQEVASFGSWINPMSDLGEFGRVNDVPSGGLAMAPSLGDFWPLLRRQAAGGIIIGDQLPMVERAVRHQEKGMDLALGTGYDIAEFGVAPVGDDVVSRCRSMVDAYVRDPFAVTHGQVVPSAPLDTEGAVFIPGWAAGSPMHLDPARATDSDNAWAAFSGGITGSLVPAELEETAELLSAWAISRGFWNDEQYEEVQERARRAGLDGVDINQPAEDTQNTSDLLTPGTRVAFTGRNELLGGPADDERLTQICRDRQLEYKSSVSKTRCDVLVAGDPASMSRKAQNAREFGKPIISQADFEHWYENGPFTTSVTETQATPVAETAQPIEVAAVSSAATSLNKPEREDTQPAHEWVSPWEFFREGSRVAFRGSTIIEGKLYPHGSALQSLCDSLGLDYKQAVTKTRSDVLVTDDPNASDGKMSLALRYGKPLMNQTDFSAWATEQLANSSENDLSGPAIHGEPVDDAEIADDENFPVAALAEPVVEHATPDEPVASPPTSTSVTHGDVPEADPTPHELMARALEQQLQATQHYANTSPAGPLIPTPSTPAASVPENKAAVRFKKWGIATFIAFAVSNVLGIAGLASVGVAGVMASFFMAIAVVVFGVQALVQKSKNSKLDNSGE